MDLQYYGANCLSVTYKNTRLVIDDNLTSLDKKSITKDSDVALFTFNDFQNTGARLNFNGSGEYEVGDISVVGVDTKPFMNDDSGSMATMFKITAADISILVTGHVFGEFNADELDRIGNIDVLVVPIGDNGYTLDPAGVLKLIKNFDPKIIVPTHYKSAKLKYPVEQIDIETAIKELAMDAKDKVAKLKLKPAELTDVTQLAILEES